VRAAVAEVKQLERSADMNDALARLLREPLSATRLDVYLQCPLRFAWQYLCGLRPPREINEGDDPAAVGTCIHDTLKALYEPYLHKTVRRGDISAETVRARFFEQLETHGLRRQLPADSCLMLEEAAPMRLMRFLENQPEQATIMALEKELRGPLRLAGRDYAFVGTMDRVDKRDGLFHVLDYKTGGIKKLDGSLWTDLAFFSRAGQLCDALHPAQEADAGHLQQLEKLFSELRERLPSLQLPCYLSMAQAGGMTPLGDAALVELRDDGKEHPLFGGLVDEDLEAALEFCNTALALPLLHMEYSPCFAARPDTHCRWCPYAGLCSV
ncbi:PD-(D/E)XK nuclease family protein, partial [Desulfovibrio sp. 1214_IL3152]